MIQHIVLFKWKDGITPAEVDSAVNALMTLSGIETVTEFSAGENFGKLAKGYHFAVVLRLPDRAALKAYWPHPTHTSALAVVQPLCADVLVSDFEL